MTRVMMRSALVALAIGLAPVAGAAQEVTIRAISTFPSALSFTQSFLGYIEKVNERGAGVIQIEFAGGPEAIPQNQQIDAVRRGIVDMQYGPASFHLGRMPEADAWVGSTVSAMEARANGGFAVMQQAFRDKLGVELIAHQDSGVQFHVYLTKEPARKADGSLDLAGLQIRSQPIYRAFFESLGVNPISVNVPDVYTGLERNTFDGAGWPISGIRDLNWDRFLRYRIDPGFFQTDLAVVMNPDSLARLSDAARAILNEVAIEYEQTSYDAFQADIARTDAAVRESGMTVITLEGEARAAYLDAAFESAWARMKEAGSEHYDALRAAYYSR